MRRTAADAFTTTNTVLRLELPSADQEIALGANVRREVFLIFKEAVNNIVKHSACSEVVITLEIEGAVLRLDVHDNGRGFDPRSPSEGYGLPCLRNRAAALGRFARRRVDAWRRYGDHPRSTHDYVNS